jgi:two-component system sensor histidine kinase BaeS
MLEDSATGVRRRRWWAGLGGKLFVAFGAVVLVGVSTLWVGVSLTAPGLFEQHMQAMMGGGPSSMMGGSSSAMDASLTAAFREAMGQALVLATLAALMAAVVASLFVTSRILRPVRQLASASRRLADGHYAERVPTDGNDELDDLAMTFNDMAATLEASERRRRELVGDIAHELRTPIATLEGYLEGLLDGVVQPEPATWARLHDETGRLRRLVDDLQELSRAEARQMPLALQPLEPQVIVGAAIDRLAPSFGDKGLGLHCDLADGLPHVQADPNRAIQVLSNLLTNALRYTPAPGEVHVDVRPVRGAVQFSVRDTGVGIAPEDLPRVFERFYRVDKSRSRALGGSGIGLTIARALVEAMGGVVWADSQGPGHGATFTFTLPRA